MVSLPFNPRNPQCFQHFSALLSTCRPYPEQPEQPQHRPFFAWRMICRRARTNKTARPPINNQSNQLIASSVFHLLSFSGGRRVPSIITAWNPMPSGTMPAFETGKAAPAAQPAGAGGGFCASFSPAFSFGRGRAHGSSAFYPKIREPA